MQLPDTRSPNARTAKSRAAVRKARRRAKRIENLCTLFTALITAVLVILAAMFVGVKLVGITPYTILSSSMTPSYLVGDLVYVKSIDPANIEAGDVIVFTTDSGSVHVTHRVARKDEEDRRFYTKGDANDEEDYAPVPYENVVGKVILRLPKMGYLASYMVSRSGRYLAFVIGCILLLLMIIPSIAS